MDYAKYSDLKGKSKQVFKKIAAVAEVKNDAGVVTTHGEAEYVVLETKQYDSYTGEEQTASTRIISLADLERDKARYTADKAKAQAQITELNKMITDIKAL